MAAHHNQARPAITRFLATEAATRALGAELAPRLRPGMVIYLVGDLGSGKTTLVRGILGALGVKERVKSPTFTLVEPYTISRLYLYHFDFYRFSSHNDWSDAGFREYFNEASICLIEWPEKAAGQLPPPDIKIVLELKGDGRSVILSAETTVGEKCLSRLKRSG